MSYDVKLSNLRVNFDKAFDKVRTPYGSNKKAVKLHKSYTWSDLYSIQSMFEQYPKRLDMYDEIVPIYEDSPIRKIEVDCNGCGDSGAIEEIRFYDDMDSQIKSTTKFVEFDIATKHTETNYEHGDKRDVISTSWYLDDDEVRELLDLKKKEIKQMSEEEFDKLDLSDFANGILKTLLDNGWLIHKVYHQGKDQRAYYTIKCEGKNTGIAEQTIMDFQGLQLPVLFPKVGKSVWESLENQTYRLLSGGWEINEGSQNTVTYFFHKKNIAVHVYEEQNVIMQRIIKKEFSLDSSLKTRFKGFLKDMFPKKHDQYDLSVDFHKKKDHEKIVEMNTYLQDLVNTKVDIEEPKEY